MSKAKQVDWRKAAPAPVVLTFGKEDYLSSRAVRSIREQLKQVHPELEVHELEAADYRAGQLLDLTSPSLFAEQKLVIIRAVEKCTDELITDGLAYLEQPSADATVIFTHSAATVRGKKLLDAMRVNSKVTEVLCLEVKKDEEKAAFVSAEFSAANKQISPAAVRALVAAFGANLIELGAACTQLAEDSASNVTEELVDLYYGGRVETTSWKISSAAFDGHAAEALSLLRHALTSGLDAVLIVSALSKSIRDYAKLAGNPTATAASLGLHPYVLEKMRKNLSKWSDDGFARVFNAVAEADAAAKGASRDPEYVIERLLILIARKGIS
ncbi:MAG: DNA polymerase III subunit delta [Rhodoluna sp.]